MVMGLVSVFPKFNVHVVNDERNPVGHFRHTGLHNSGVDAA